MGGIKKQDTPTNKEIRELLDAVSKDPKMQRLWKYFEETPPPWPKMRDVPPSTP